MNKMNVVFRFDYEGIGDSSGDLEKVTFENLRDNLYSIIDQLTSGPQVIES